MNKTTSVLSATFLLTIIIQPQFAYAAQPVELDGAQATQGYSTEAKPCDTPIINEMGGASVKTSITIDGIENPLYCTFNDTDQAIAKVAEKAAHTLDSIAQDNSLPPLNLSNWGTYRELYQQSDSQSDDSAQEDFWLNSFFDVIENEEINAEIINGNESSSAGDEAFPPSSLDDGQTSSITTSLPYYAPSYIDRSKQMRSQAVGAISPSAVPNVNSAIRYAFAHAKTHNTNYHYWKGNDCTNFASQILQAGGVKQGNGWTYGGRLGSSRAWYNADAFAKHWGINSRTVDHRTFSQWVARGNFIGLDYTRDGSCDHIGFVVNKGGDIGRYYNYQVAQHNNDYVDLVDSSTNRWENHPGANYIILSR